MKIEALKPKILSSQLIANVDRNLGLNLGLNLDKHSSIGIITCDQDDSLYAALDHATKFASVDIVYAKSFYAGANHQSGPFSGEVIGIIAGADAQTVSEGLFALHEALENDISFYQFAGMNGPTFFPHVIANAGHYLSNAAGIPLGSSMAYLVAPPMESVVALDLALKSANVSIAKYFGPPTETNFGGAYLVGELPEVLAAREAFIEGIYSMVKNPLSAHKNPERYRR